LKDKYRLGAAKPLFEDGEFRGGKALKLRCNGCSGFSLLLRQNNKRSSHEIVLNEEGEYVQLPLKPLFHVDNQDSCLEHFNMVGGYRGDCFHKPVELTKKELLCNGTFCAINTQKSTHLNRSRMPTETISNVVSATSHTKFSASGDIIKKVFG
jgi:hypothetical protein